MVDFFIIDLFGWILFIMLYKEIATFGLMDKILQQRVSRWPYWRYKTIKCFSFGKQILF